MLSALVSSTTLSTTSPALAGVIPPYFLEWNHLIFLFGMFGAAIGVNGNLLQAYWKQSKTKEKPAGEDKTRKNI